MSRILADRKDGGRGGVSLCGGCEDVHVRWGELTLSMDRARFLELARMLNAGARVLGPEPVPSVAVAGRGAALVQ